jgi:hypothetical protein
VAYRDELEALRARLAAVEAERDAARDAAKRLEAILHGEPRSLTRRRSRAVDPRWRSVPGGEPTPITVRNESARKIELIWLSHEGKERSAGTLVPGGVVREQTYVGYCWRIVDARTGEILHHVRVEDEDEPTIVFTGVPEPA